jgi:hypothetical protein
VEVKYRSGKSAFASEEEEAPTDQLAKEWTHLICRAERMGAIPKLLYITGDAVIPRFDISEAGREFEAKRATHQSYQEFECHWLSWRSLHGALAKSQGSLAGDLRLLAEKLDLKEFDGFSEILPAAPPHWRYCSSYNWNISVSGAPVWRYTE